MTKEFSKIAPVLVFIIVALGIAAMVFFPMPWNEKRGETYATRVIIPQSPSAEESYGDTFSGNSLPVENLLVKVQTKETEIVVAVLTDDFDGDLKDEQFVAYRSLAELESPIYLSYIAYDYSTEGYREFWSAPTGATVPGTVSLYTQDMIGDRSLCVILAGMNGIGEHTLTVFRKNSGRGAQEEMFTKIAELRKDGSISIRQTDRSQAYNLGIANGASFPISAYSRDQSSSNMMDQLEYLYTFDESKGVYSESRVTKIPGIQIEQRRVQELLGSRAAFEEFVTGLWYYVSPQGTIDNRQYIYFDPANREIIFYGDETQQVFSWQTSTTTRYGLYISTQNISVTAIRRSVDINLVSMENINIRVFEDARFKFGTEALWDGSYRKSIPPQNRRNETALNNSYFNAVYDSSIGKIIFTQNGDYEILAGNGTRSGKYAFFNIGNQEILELRSVESVVGSNGTRETYMVTTDGQASGRNSVNPALKEKLFLEKVRIGAGFIESLYEGTLVLNPE